MLTKTDTVREPYGSPQRRFLVENRSTLDPAAAAAAIAA